MPIVLAENQYGKSENRVVRVVRDGGTHHIKDMNVGVSLSGDMEAVHLTGDNGNCLPTDTQKNTVFAFARKYGIVSPEDFALKLAHHFVDNNEPIHGAQVRVEEYSWERIPVAEGAPHLGLRDKQHSFVRNGQETRTARINIQDGEAHVVSGLKDLLVMNSTDSEFWGYLKDEYTTIKETNDRILATSITADWRHASPVKQDDEAWNRSYEQVRRHMLEAFAETRSFSLQQTMYAIAERVIENVHGIVEMRLSCPNKHHFLADLEPFGMDNPNEVFFAADRPYGLIEARFLAENAPEAGAAWTRFLQ